MKSKASLVCGLLILWLPGMSTTGSPSASPTTTSPSSVRSSFNSISTAAGTGSAASTGTGGVATAMTLNSPYDIWEDTNGNIYVAEYSSSCVRKFSYPNGIVQNFAGVCGSTGYSGNNGPATAAKFWQVLGVGMGTAGVYISDTGNDIVRLVSNNIVTTFFGQYNIQSNSGDGSVATSATIGSPSGIWLDTPGQVYVVSYFFGFVRKINTFSIVSTFAGEVTE